MYKAKAPLHRSLACMISVVVVLSGLVGCASPGNYKVVKACAGRDYCPERDGPRQYVRAPDGWGGKYCLQHPMEC